MGTSPERHNGEKSAVTASKKTPDIRKATSDALEGTQIACNTKKAKGTNPWPSSLSELATENTRERFFAAAAMREKVALVRMALRLVPIVNQHASLSVLGIFSSMPS